MPLFEVIPIDESEIKVIVKENYSLELGKCLKASQNHVYLAQSSDDTKFIVRVIPDPLGKRQKDLEVEVALLDFLQDNNLPVCKVNKFRKFLTHLDDSNTNFTETKVGKR